LELDLNFISAVETFKEFNKKTSDPLKGQTDLGYADSIGGNINNAIKLLIKAGFKE